MKLNHSYEPIFQQIFTSNFETCLEQLQAFSRAIRADFTYIIEISTTTENGSEHILKYRILSKIQNNKIRVSWFQFQLFTLLNLKCMWYVAFQANLLVVVCFQESLGMMPLLNLSLYHDLWSVVAVAERKQKTKYISIDFSIYQGRINHLE